MKYVSTVSFQAPDQQTADLLMKAVRVTLQAHAVAGLTITPPVDDFSSDKSMIVYTDGGCDAKKDGIGAWAYLRVHPNGSVTESVGCYHGTTNNRMEMLAVINALAVIPEDVPVTVVSDSEYVIKGITVWIRNWVRNGWRSAGGGPVKNQDLWEILLALYKTRKVKFEHVKGHTGHPQNERCDALCTDAMIEGHKRLLNGESVDLDVGAPQYA